MSGALVFMHQNGLSETPMSSISRSDTDGLVVIDERACGGGGDLFEDAMSAPPKFETGVDSVGSGSNWFHFDLVSLTRFGSDLMPP